MHHFYGFSVHFSPLGFIILGLPPNCNPFDEKICPELLVYFDKFCFQNLDEWAKQKFYLPGGRKNDKMLIELIFHIKDDPYYEQTNE